MCPRKASADHPGQELWTGFVSRPLDSGALSLFACFTGEGVGQVLSRTTNPPKSRTTSVSGTRSPVSTFRRILGPGFDRPNERLGSIFPFVAPFSWNCPHGFLEQLYGWLCLSSELGLWRLFLRLTTLQAPDLPIPPASWDKPAH